MCRWAGLLLHRHVSDPGAAVSVSLGTRWVNEILVIYKWFLPNGVHGLHFDHIVAYFKHAHILFYFI